MTDRIAKRFQELIPRIQHLPPRGSRPLAIRGRVAGWISAAATHHVGTLPGVHVEDEAVHIAEAPGEGLALDEVLAAMAHGLRDTGCLRGWRDELLDVIGEGQTLSVIERAAVRPLGLLTRAVHLSAWAPDGRMWVARRADSKFTDPGLWDTLVGGLVAAGETAETSLLRESQEEAGLAAADMTQRTPLRTVVRMHRRLPEGYQVEDMLVSDCVLDDATKPVNQDGEVSDMALLGVDDLWAWLVRGEFTVEAELAILDSLRARAAGAGPFGPKG